MYEANKKLTYWQSLNTPAWTPLGTIAYAYFFMGLTSEGKWVWVYGACFAFCMTLRTLYRIANDYE